MDMILPFSFICVPRINSCQRLNLSPCFLKTTRSTFSAGPSYAPFRRVLFQASVGTFLLESTGTDGHSQPRSSWIHLSESVQHKFSLQGQISDFCCRGWFGVAMCSNSVPQDLVLQDKEVSFSYVQFVPQVISDCLIKMLTAWAGQKRGGRAKFPGLRSQAGTRRKREDTGRRKKPPFRRWIVSTWSRGPAYWSRSSPGGTWQVMSQGH